MSIAREIANIWKAIGKLERQTGKIFSRGGNGGGGGGSSTSGGSIFVYASSKGELPDPQVGKIGWITDGTFENALCVPSTDGTEWVIFTHLE